MFSQLATSALHYWLKCSSCCRLSRLLTLPFMSRCRSASQSARNEGVHCYQGNAEWNCTVEKLWGCSVKLKEWKVLYWSAFWFLLILTCHSQFCSFPDITFHSVYPTSSLSQYHQLGLKGESKLRHEGGMDNVFNICSSHLFIKYWLILRNTIVCQIKVKAVVCTYGIVLVICGSFLYMNIDADFEILIFKRLTFLLNVWKPFLPFKAWQV